MNPLQELKRFGQSPWLDDLRRGMFTGGWFRRLMEEDGICGLTSNPAILAKAILETDDYREALRTLRTRYREPEARYEALVLEDIRLAADALEPVYRESHRLDGYVSLEISPDLAYDAETSVREAERLWRAVDRPNLMIKIPATTPGLDAIRELTRRGINVNATLLFSPLRYAQVAEAWRAGMAERVAAREPVEGMASVASFFVSRIDTLADRLLAEQGTDDALALQGEVAVAAARMAYRTFKQLRDTTAWQLLVDSGVRVQRLLWASTSTKNPAYPDVKYVDALVGPHTVTTLPLPTLEAYRDHGRPGLRLEEGLDGAKEIFDAVAAVGLDFEAMAEQLEREGVVKFQEAYHRLLEVLGTDG